MVADDWSEWKERVFENGDVYRWRTSPSGAIDGYWEKENTTRPEIYHIVDVGINHGRTHCLCGLEITWTNYNPLRSEWCKKCEELDG